MRVCGFSVLHFAGEQVQRSLCLRDVVAPRGAAANLRVGQFHEVQVGDGAQKLARGFADFLSVEQVAGVLISDANFRGGAGSRVAPCPVWGG